MKKGVGDTLMFYSAVVIIFFSLFILFMLPSFIDREAKIVELNIENDINFNLLNYLKTSVVVDDEKTTLSDLINLWYYNREYEDLLDKETNKIFKKLYGNCFNARIEDGGAIKKFGTLFRDNRHEKSVTVPLYGKDVEFVINPSQYYIIKEKFNVDEVCSIV